MLFLIKVVWTFSYLRLVSKKDVTMTIRAIQSNENDNLSTVVKASAVGAALGYASKYVLPITTQEREDKNYHETIKIAREQSKKLKGEFIEEIRNIPNRSLAQDQFLKIVDVDKPVIKPSIIKEAMAKLGGTDSVNAIEFKNILARMNETAIKRANTIISVYEGYVKRIRPTAPFVVAGALTGLFAGVTHNILKTESATRKA
jgi:metal-dependent amidase/aminoacylase/carboxypeptidase family protein